MADTPRGPHDTFPDPTGRLGEKASERSSGDTEPQAYAGDTVQHVSRGSRDQRPAGDEGTAERPPYIDRSAGDY
jgi:hypothetical protein